MNRSERRRIEKAGGLIGVDGEKLEKKKPHICVGMPTYRFAVDIGTKDSINGMMAYMRQKGYRVSMYQSDSALVAKGRNDSVAAAVELKADYLMFIDSDMTFERNHIEMLLEHDRDVVGGLCTKRVAPFTSTVYFFREEAAEYVPVDAADPNALVLDALTECDGTGSAFLLIKMSVFDKLRQPYFAMPPAGWLEIVEAARKTVVTGANKEMVALRDAVNKSDGLDGFTGEDLFFCNQLRGADIKVAVDTGVLIGHIGDYPFTYLDRLGLVEVQGIEHKDDKRVAGAEGGVRSADGAGVASLLRATRKAKALPSVAS